MAILSAYSIDIPYKFLHDRVQQAAYSLIPEAEKNTVHLQIGRLLLQNIKDNELETKIFDVVNQLNEGLNLITDPLEKKELTKLNLQAGKKAASSTAYESALKYLEISLKLLPINSWNQQYKLTLAVHLETLETLYLNAKWERVEQLSIEILKKVSNVLDSVRVYELKILSDYAQFKPEAAIDHAIEILKDLGISMSPITLNTTEIKHRIQQENQSLKCLLEENNLEYLASLSKMTDPYKLAAISILQPVMSATWTINFPLFVEIILTQLNLCLQYNNPPQAAAIYGGYGMLLCSIIEDIELGYQFGKLSIVLLEKYNIPKLETLVWYLYYVFIRLWKEPINDTIAREKFLDALQKGIDTGNNEYTCYFCLSYCYMELFGGANLVQLESDARKYTKLIKNLNQEYSIEFIEIIKNTIISLRIKNQDQQFFLIGDCQEEEDLFLEKYLQQQNQW